MPSRIIPASISFTSKPTPISRNKVIANRLKITEATVKVHLKGLLRKISVSNRTQAAIWAVERGIDKYPLSPGMAPPPAFLSRSA